MAPKTPPPPVTALSLPIPAALKLELAGTSFDLDQLRQRCYQLSKLPEQDLHQQAEEPLPSPMGMAEAPRTRRRRSNAEEA